MGAARVIALCLLVVTMLLSACAQDTAPAAKPNECVICHLVARPRQDRAFHAKNETLAGRKRLLRSEC